MKGFENTFNFAPADAERGGGRLRIQRFETVFASENMQYLQLRDIQRFLVPTLRRESYEDVVLVIYKGDSDEIIAELGVHDDGQKTTLFDEEGTQISLFAPPPGARVQRPKDGEVQRVLIHAWLKNKGYRTDEVTFCPFFKESQEADLVDATESSLDEVVPEETENISAAPDVRTRSKPVRKRPLNARKKKTKEEIKDRKKENAEREYDLVITMLALHCKNRESEIGFDALSGLATFLRQYPMYIQRVASLLQTDTALQPVKDALIQFKTEKPRLNVSSVQRHYNSELGSSLAKFDILQTLAEKIFNTTDARYRSSYEYTPYRMDRDFLLYWHGLFSFDTSLEDLVTLIENAQQETWVDIGSGTTYKNPRALINIIDKINPRIHMIGVDPLYDQQKARKLDVVSGASGIDESFAQGHTLLPDYAQQIELPSSSIDRIISFGVFDKFNLQNGSELQAFYELARLLKSGGEARIFPVRKKFLDIHRQELLTFFDMFETQEDLFKGEKVRLVKLVRKEISGEEIKQLESRNRNWKN